MGSANFNDRSQKGDGDSEIVLVVEDEDMIKTTMNGKPYMAARFAASLRRKLTRQHLGLIKPQIPQKAHEQVTSFMRAAPVPNDDEFDTEEDALVADPLSDDFEQLWRRTAHDNRAIFQGLFKPVPSDLVRNNKQYEEYLPKVVTGHVVPGVSLDRVKTDLARVKGSLVDMPLAS